MTQTIITNNGFRLTRSREIPEMQGILWAMEHPKSGAKLVWLDRSEENMTFAIAFRTIPTDSTGVFHILEHSVLGGSEKYPVKEPFVELLKSSLQTFLNAMTFPDKTVYPFSSRNKQDFRNLMGVYMDAVLHPLAVKTPNIFLQEGWHVEPGEPPVYQGVVYNEMKGAFSNVRSVLEHVMMKELLPDTCYRHESGGDPDHIAELTYEQFCAEHAKYYHPSNALIVLDGAVDLDASLGFLNSVLQDYDKQDMVFPIPVQEAVAYHEMEVPYEIGESEDPSGKTILSFGKVLCGFDDPETLLAANILGLYLADGSAGRLKRAVLEAGLGEDMSVGLHDGMQQNWFGWQLWNTSRPEEAKAFIRKTLTEMADNGLDRERLLGCCNAVSIQLLDRDGAGFPRGLLEAINILEPWLYGGDPAQNLAYKKTMEAVTAKLDTGYFENLLRTCLLDTDSGVLVTLTPSPTMGQERVQREQKRMEEYWGGLTETEKTAICTQVDALHQWQQTPNSPEELATIPMLRLEDVTEEPKPLNMEVTETDGVPTLLHNVDSALCYIDLHFEASDLSREEMPVLSLLAEVLGSFATRSHTSMELATLKRQKLGELNMSTSIYHKTQDAHRSLFTVRATSLPGSRKEAAELVTEILTTTVFDNADQARNILRQEKGDCQRSLITAGNRYAVSRVNARQTSAGAAKEWTNGCEYITWIAQTAEAEDLTSLLEQLEALTKKLFTRERLIISLSRNAEDLAQGFAAAFPVSGEIPAKQTSFALLPPRREGIQIPAGVAYAAKGANVAKFGQKFQGQNYVLSKILSLQHLWAEIRVKGGAYGSGFVSADSGDVFCYSYRDPNPGRSLEQFDACADFIEAFCAQSPDLTGFVLGALSDSDPLLSAEDKVHLAEARWFKGTSHENVLRLRSQLRSTTPEDLTELAKALRCAAAENNYCVVGGKEQLEACGEKIEKIWEIQA